MGLIVYPLPQFIHWSLNPQYIRMWMVFGERAFKEMVKLKWAREGESYPIWLVSF